MKCAKCDYVSFDYLSECKNCHASLEAVRAGLRFPVAKPTAQSLLGSLLSAPTAEVAQSLSAAQSPAYEAANLEQETAISFDEGFQIDSASEGGQFSATDESNEDFSLLDISDEELGTLIVGHDEFEKEQREDSRSIPEPTDELELDLGDFLDTKESKLEEPQKVAAANAEDDFAIDLSEGDLDNFLKQLEKTTGGKA
jgi:hypothetical protein